MATELAQAYVQIMPSARGIQGSLSQLMGGEASAAGESAGRSLGGKLVGAALGIVSAAAIGQAFGARLINLKEVYHGIASPIQVTVPDPLFAGMGETFTAGRYHSWVVDPEDFPSCLEVIAQDTEGRQIMGLRHKTYDVKGIQFHPESVLTPQGNQIIRNWLKA